MKSRTVSCPSARIGCTPAPSTAGIPLTNSPTASSVIMCSVTVSGDIKQAEQTGAGVFSLFLHSIPRFEKGIILNVECIREFAEPMEALNGGCNR